MNILILTTHFNKGGISRYILNLSKGLVARNHKVWVASDEGDWVGLLNQQSVGYKYIPIKTKSFLSPKLIVSFLKLIPFIRKEKIEIIHANPRVTQALACLLFLFLRIPYVSTFHGFYRPSLMRRVLPFSGVHTIAVSFAVKSHLIKDLSIPENRVSVVYNGIDRNEFADKQHSKVELGFRDGDYLLGILGRISAEKGHFLAVDALAKLVKKQANVYLLISGEGKLKRSLVEYIKKSGLEERAKFIDWQTTEVLDVLDVLLVPSEKEGFGYVIVEAMAKAVPVIGFNVGGIAEIIEDKVNGLLFYEYCADALTKVIDNFLGDWLLHDKIVASAKVSLDKFSIEQMAKNTEEVYKKVSKGD